MPRTTTVVARATSPVKSGTLMHPSRPADGPWASTTSGLNSTTRPWHERALRWPVTSRANARTPTPICGAASPTHAGDARIVSTRSTATARAAPLTASNGTVGRLRIGSGSRTTGRTATRHPLEDVGLGRVEADVDAHLRRQLLQLRTEVASVRRGRDRDLE